MLRKVQQLLVSAHVIQVYVLQSDEIVFLPFSFVRPMIFVRPQAGNHLLATYRCQVDVNRLDLRFRTTEGQYGTLQTFITPNIQPKVSQLQEYQIRPLSLHMRIHSIDAERPHNQLILKGSFSLAEIHNWIGNCVPEVPGKSQPNDQGKYILYFRNVFVGSQLMCEYT